MRPLVVPPDQVEVTVLDIEVVVVDVDEEVEPEVEEVEGSEVIDVDRLAGRVEVDGVPTE